MHELMVAGQDRRFVGRRLHFDGQDWTVLYTDVAARMTLPAAGLDSVLSALRAGTIILQTDPEAIAAQAAPANRAKAVREWLVLDATIAGARARTTLPENGVELLEGRLAVLTEYLRRQATPAVTAPIPSRLARRMTRILVVDGSALVRLLIGGILRNGGYRVWTANGAGDVRHVLRLMRHPFHLLLTEIALAVGSGPELAAEVRRMHPGVRVLYVSSSTHEHLLAHGVQLNGVALLPKPFMPAQLLERVEESLSD